MFDLLSCIYTIIGIFKVSSSFLFYIQLLYQPEPIRTTETLNKVFFYLYVLLES